MRVLEGNKSTNCVGFTNSDPALIKTFLNLFRKSFVIDESKFRVCVHLHAYHKINKQLNFWSKCTNIPLSNFIKPFMKSSSGLYKKEGYQGCVSIRYYDSKIAKELKYLALEYMNGPIG